MRPGINARRKNHRRRRDVSRVRIKLLDTWGVRRSPARSA